MTEQAYRRPDLTLDQQVALEAAASRLGQEFAGVYGEETIERFLRSSYDRFALRATVSQFLPLLAERFARQQLKALARVEGKRHDGKPVVLFLCVHNAGRSQMAMGFLTHLGGDAATAWSGGTEPAAEVNAAAVAAMRERGIDISREFPSRGPTTSLKPPTSWSPWAAATACPVFPGKRYLDWQLDDPAGLSVEDVRPIRDEIERRVRALLDELGAPAHG